MHVTRLKVFKVEGFDRPYPTTHMRRQVQKWEAEELEDVNMDELDMTEEMPPGTKGPKPPAGGEADKAEKDRRTKVGAETKREGAGDAEPGKPAERGKLYEKEKARLRERLEVARLQDQRWSLAMGPCRTRKRKMGRSPLWAPPVSLQGKAILPRAGWRRPASLIREGASACAEEGKEGKKEAKRGGPEEEEESKQITFEEEEEEERPGRGGFKRWYFEYLADPAVTASSRHCPPKDLQSQRGEEETSAPEHWASARQDPYEVDFWRQGSRKKRRSESSERGQERGIQEEEEEEEERRGRPRREPLWEQLGDVELRQRLGRNVNELSRQEDGGAPLRKAQEKPGSVLQLLIEHARSQLDQSSKVGIGSKEEVSVTLGVKLSSYFAIVVKPPQMNNALAQARECHHLDLLDQAARYLDLLGTPWRGGS